MNKIVTIYTTMSVLNSPQLETGTIFKVVKYISLKENAYNVNKDIIENISIVKNPNTK